MKSICKGYNCNNLIDTPGYCPEHTREVKPRDHWDNLDSKKTPEQIKFYSGRRWNRVSKEYRRNNPLCEVCKVNGKTTKVQLVHHDPTLQNLLDSGLDPYDSKYLHGICNRCHMAELRGYKGNNTNNTNNRTLFERMGI